MYNPMSNMNANPQRSTMTGGGNPRTFDAVSPFKPEFDAYIMEYPGRGRLKIQISAANEAFPVKDVEIMVSMMYQGVKYLLYDDKTDSSGIVDNMVLPSRPVDTELEPERSDADEAHYLVSLYHPAFQSVIDKMVTIYDRIETILPITMMPDPQNIRQMQREGN